MEPLYLVAVIKPVIEKAEDARAYLAVMMAAAAQEEGCHFYDLVVSEDEPDTWLMLEKWASREAWDAHMLTDHVATGNAAMANLLREPTELRFYQPK
jgi:quinol monooxygenase YgiN